MKKVDVLSLDGKSLRLFLAVFDLESVGKAADQLDLSQSAVSHSLEKIRRCLNDPLFVKNGRGITPTNTAHLIAPRARAILAQMEGLAVDNNYDPAQDTTPVTIATNLTELLPALDMLRQEVWRSSPTSRIRFIELGSRENILPYLAKGKADLIFNVSFGRLPPEICSKPFSEDRHVCFFDKNKEAGPLSLEKFANARHATLDFGGTGKSIVELAANQSGLTRDICLSVSNSFALATMMKGTDLVATLPKKLEKTAFKGFGYCEPPFSVPIVRTTMLWHRRAHESGKRIWLSQLAEKAIRHC